MSKRKRSNRPTQLAGSRDEAISTDVRTRPVELFRRRVPAELASFDVAWKPGDGNVFEKLSRP